MKVSILILTFNEEVNLPRCLNSLVWCDDIVVVDSGSTDQTISIAEHAGARILTRKFDNFAGQRNFGLEHGLFKHEWVLHLDADEVLTDAFQLALERLIPVDGIDAYFVPSRTMLFETWLKHAGMWPTYQVRLGHRDRLRFIQVGHGQREDLPLEKTAKFEEPYLHYSFSHGLTSWLQKHIRYAHDEAIELVKARNGLDQSIIERNGKAADLGVNNRRRLKMAANRVPLFLRPFARFFYVYVLKRGFLDGHRGFLYAFMLAVYEGMIAILAYEKWNKVMRDPVSPPH
jgi:glycosyltransferase involved in cell wall biosynthesis